MEWLLRAAECGGPRMAASALQPWRRAAGGLAGALGAQRGSAACERLVGGVLRRLARAAGASWRAEVAAAAEAVSADRNGTTTMTTTTKTGVDGGCGGGGGRGSSGCGSGDAGGAVRTDIDDDDELSVVPELEAAVAATHAALGSLRFLTLVHSALSGASVTVGSPPTFAGWENAAAALHVLAACGYPLTSDGSHPPALNAIVQLLVVDTPPAVIGCAPLAAGLSTNHAHVRSTRGLTEACIRVF